MKGLLVSAAVFALVGGAAFAQTSDTTAPPAAAPDASVPAPAAPAATPDASAPSGSMGAAPAAAPARSAASDAAAAMIGPPPESYPICKSRTQDRCQQPHFARKEARRRRG
jgi:hypothetical protein